MQRRRCCIRFLSQLFALERCLVPAVLVLSLSGLLACAQSALTPARDTPTVPTTHPATAPGTVTTPQTSVPPAPTPLGATDCGMIALQGNRVSDGPTASAAGKCFLQAFQQCAVGSLLFVANQRTADDTLTTNYRISRDGDVCTINVAGSATVLTQESVMGTIVGISKGVPPTIGACRSLQQDAMGTLHFLDCKSPIENTDVPTSP